MEVDIKRLHEILYKMMSLFHEFCKKNKLKYTISAGSVLGAVRHGGIIPWDDDIDIVMPRLDYNRFIQMTKDNFIEGYKVCTIYNTPRYRWPYAKIIDLNTTLFSTKQELDCILGVFIDIFPLDGFAADELITHQMQKKYFRYLGIANVLRNGFNIKPLKNAVKYVIGKILFQTYDKAIIKCEKIAQAYNYEETPYLGQFFTIYTKNGYKEIYPRYIYSDIRPIKFGPIKVMCISDTEKYLNHLYGDYMVLPPLEKRFSHHNVYYINLDKRLTSIEIENIR